MNIARARGLAEEILAVKHDGTSGDAMYMQRVAQEILAALSPSEEESEGIKALVSMDLPDPEDLAALDLSDYDPDNEEPGKCAAIVPMTTMASRDCGKPATHIFTFTRPDGLGIIYALCDEHAP